MLVKEKKQDSRGSFEVVRREDWIENPEISAVMSVYNGENTVRYAIESILNQTFTNFEFIIINDGSIDRTFDILIEYLEQDNRIVIINQQNIGLTKSLNRGIETARGKYIARQDADDISLPKRFQKERAVLEKKKEVVLVSCRAFQIIKNKKVLSRYFRENEIEDTIKRFNPFIHSSVMFRRETFLKIGLYDETFTASQDYDAWIRLSREGKLYMINEVLLKYYVSKNSISSTKKILQCKTSFKIRKKHKTLPLHLNLCYSMYQFISSFAPVWLISLRRKLREKSKIIKE